MNDEAGRLGRLERTLWVPLPGIFTKKSRVFFVALGVFLSASNAYSLLVPSGDGPIAEVGTLLIGLAFFLWGIGDAMKAGGAGAIIRLSYSMLTLPVAAIVIPISLYIEMGFWGLVFSTVLVATLFGLNLVPEENRRQTLKGTWKLSWTMTSES